MSVAKEKMKKKKQRNDHKEDNSSLSLLFLRIIWFVQFILICIYYKYNLINGNTMVLIFSMAALAS